MNSALRDALEADERVVVFGEDVGRLGGVFRITDGLADTFGERRCFDTPACEAGLAGLAVGMAMAGFRPVVEMQFDAFAYPAFEQIASHIAKLRNRTRGALALPLVIRVPYGGGIGGVEHHSDSSEAYCAHTAGLKVVTPATVADAYSLLREAVDDPDPVVFLEPKRHYWTKDDVRLPSRTEPFGTAAIRRPGTAATLVAYCAAGEIVEVGARLMSVAQPSGEGGESADSSPEAGSAAGTSPGTGSGAVLTGYGTGARSGLVANTAGSRRTVSSAPLISRAYASPSTRPPRSSSAPTATHPPSPSGRTRMPRACSPPVTPMARVCFPCWHAPASPGSPPSPN
ncbi:hypothetical protein [Streptomyces afghaniensis]|uniref:alpha-ketoacid dehydrogenase subunit beta n=1 Tax=Streptomyces afghaniensis TaxID=66865 RepID=UPI003F4B36CE